MVIIFKHGWLVPFDYVWVSFWRSTRPAKKKSTKRNRLRRPRFFPTIPEHMRIALEEAERGLRPVASPDRACVAQKDDLEEKK